MGPTAGEAIPTCNLNTPPVSHLGAHRALTTSEAARLYALAVAAGRGPASGHRGPVPAGVDRPTATLAITRGPQTVVLAVSDGPRGLSADVQETWRLLREIADELRRTARR
jgi:hypothetical protein